MYYGSFLMPYNGEYMKRSDRMGAMIAYTLLYAVYFRISTSTFFMPFGEMVTRF